MAARYTARLNGVTAIALTRLDVLDQLPTIKVCTEYQLGGERTNSLPASRGMLARATPIYEELAGWQQDTSTTRRFNDLQIGRASWRERV